MKLVRNAGMIRGRVHMSIDCISLIDACMIDECMKKEGYVSLAIEDISYYADGSRVSFVVSTDKVEAFRTTYKTIKDTL